jgi:3'(2'), 5'-bisphosphate nucleotidase
MFTEIEKLYPFALEAAVEASLAILDVYANPFETELKQDGSPVTKADLISSKIINQKLTLTQIPIINEETEAVSYDERKKWEKVWCVDPLDGTKEFVKRNGEFVVNIALIENQKPILGIIAHPISKQIIMGGPQIGVFLFDFIAIENKNDWKKIEPKSITNHPLMMACSRSHHSGPVLRIINKYKENNFEVDFIKMGSALKFFELAEGRADFYPRFAPTMEWDIAAGDAILQGIGGKVIHAETNEPLVYNKDNLTNPYFIAYTAPCEIYEI